jgi:hypothetical protein
MATWKWVVNGKTVYGDGPTEQDAWDNYRSAHRVLDPAPEGAPKDTPERELGNPREIFPGFIQGAVLDPLEGAGQLIEHAITAVTGKKPHATEVKKILKDFRDRAQSTWFGRGAEVAGNIAGLALPAGAAARGVTSFAGRIPGISSTLAGIAGGAAGGTAAGAVMPVEGDPNEFVNTKLDQLAVGALTGGALPALARGLSSVVPPTAHMSRHHPWFSMLPRLSRVGGSLLGHVAPESAGAAMATVPEEAKRHPLTVTIHPDMPIRPEDLPASEIPP